MKTLDTVDGEFDYIVVGAGTAGCLMANRLSTDPAKRVLLLEAGGRDNYLWIHIPVGYLYCIGNPRTDWLYATEPDPGLAGRSIRYPRGKVFGGCSSINGMIYMRGQKADYDGWAALGNEGWSWDEVLPYFLKHEDYYKLDGGGSNDPLHGHGGEWRVERQRLSWSILDAWREAAAQCGIPPVEDFNRGDNFGCGYFEVNQRRGVRWNAAKAFLKPALKRPNLKVITNAHVQRLRLARDADGALRATGIEFSAGGATLAARASGEIVMCAGAIGTPQILQLSGIGPRAVLESAGVRVEADVPGVGANLQDHLQLRTIYRLQGARTLNQIANSWIGRAGMGAQYVFGRRGPMTMSPSQLGAFARSNPSVAQADVEYHVQPLSLDKFGDPLHPFPAMTASVCNLRPESRGTVSIRTPRADDSPAIAPNYLSTEGDRTVAADSLRLTRRIMAADALRRYVPQEYAPGPQYQTDAELAQAAAQVGTTIFHPVGTCRMGPSGHAGTVVDAELRMHAVRGVRIADASVMPTITSGNTNSPTLMIAEKAAAMILGAVRPMRHQDVVPQQVAETMI